MYVEVQNIRLKIALTQENETQIIQRKMNTKVKGKQLATLDVLQKRSLMWLIMYMLW